VIADNYYALPSVFEKYKISNSPIDQAMLYLYIWDGNPNSIAGNIDVAWSKPYLTVVPTSNLVLDILPSIPIVESNRSAWNSIKGGALLHRAIAFYDMAQLYSPPYSMSTSNVDLGIVLKLTSDINETIKRSTV